MFGRATIRLGIGPHSSYSYFAFASSLYSMLFRTMLNHAGAGTLEMQMRIFIMRTIASKANGVGLLDFFTVWRGH